MDRLADTRPQVSILVAASENHVIGRDGDLPWRLSADLKRFKALTMGHAMIMGRVTYESIGRPLPGRKSIVLSRALDWNPGNEEVATVKGLQAAFEHLVTDQAFVIGGGQIYRLALPQADRIYLTRVHATIEGDATFPEIDPAEWRLSESEAHEADDRNEHDFTFEVWDRIHS